MFRKNDLRFWRHTHRVLAKSLIHSIFWFANTALSLSSTVNALKFGMVLWISSIKGFLSSWYTWQTNSVWYSFSISCVQKYVYGCLTVEVLIVFRLMNWIDAVVVGLLRLVGIDVEMSMQLYVLVDDLNKVMAFLSCSNIGTAKVIVQE